MLRVHVAGCNDCLQVIEHILSEYVGITEYVFDKHKNVLLNQEYFEPEILKEAIDELNASGIDTSLVTADDPDYEFNRPLSKRMRYSGGVNYGSGEFIKNVEKLTVVLDPANRCQRGHNVPAWCVTVAPLSSMSSFISALALLKPLPSALNHVKRAFVQQNDQLRVGKVLLGLATKSFTKEDAMNLVSAVCVTKGISGGALESCRVPLCSPRSCLQQKTLSSLIKDSGGVHSWPFHFHPDQNLESLLSIGDRENSGTEPAKPYFSSDEISWHNHWLRLAVDLAKGKASGAKNASCDLEAPNLICTCVVTHRPSTNCSVLADSQPLTIAVSTDAEFCIEHAAMLAANRVGRLNRELKDCAADGFAKPGSEANYLLTDCDAYLSTEPCLMCTMALLHSRVARVFIARRLPSIGGMCSRWKLPLVKAVNHHFLVFAPPDT